MSKILLVITFCSNLGCLPPMTNEKWVFTNENDCYKKGYYAIAEIAETKMPDLNTNDLDQAKLQVAGTARSMGIEVN